jgi:two-component system response regulator CpxR
MDPDGGMLVKGRATLEGQLFKDSVSPQEEFEAMNHVLIIDDDHVLVELLREFLASEGFTVDVVHDYDSGLAAALNGKYELVVLDIMLPGGSGLELLKVVRASCKVPVVLLSAMGDTVDRVMGLQIGADDHLTKPFEPRELAARIHAILRRSRAIPMDDNEIKVGDIELSATRRAVVCAETPVKLTAVEFNVLECLLRNAGNIVSRETLAKRALGRPLTPFDRAVDVHVHNVRKKISAPPGERIKTIRGVGYMYARPVEDVE